MSTSHTLAEKHEVLSLTSPVGQDTHLITFLFQLTLLQHSFLEMGNTNVLIASQAILYYKKHQNFGKCQHHHQSIYQVISPQQSRVCSCSAKKSWLKLLDPSLFAYSCSKVLAKWLSLFLLVPPQNANVWRRALIVANAEAKQLCQISLLCVPSKILERFIHAHIELIIIDPLLSVQQARF